MTRRLSPACAGLVLVTSALIAAACSDATPEELAERYGFEIQRHRHELYGHCADCRGHEK